MGEDNFFYVVEVHKIFMYGFKTLQKLNTNNRHKHRTVSEISVHIFLHEHAGLM
jgi:hypothetical protein